MKIVHTNTTDELTMDNNCPASQFPACVLGGSQTDTTMISSSPLTGCSAKAHAPPLVPAAYTPACIRQDPPRLRRSTSIEYGVLLRNCVLTVALF